MATVDTHSHAQVVILVMVRFDGVQEEEGSADEFTELARSCGADVKAQFPVRCQPNARYLIGKGKVEELAQCVKQHACELVLVNQPLTPSQMRNLETHLCCRVFDRSNLILDIFAQRAQSRAGQLQVELAQLTYLSTRLVRGWTHLERQKGGIGLRGPGETQLELDRRMLRERIKSIKKRLIKVNTTRALARRSRAKSGILTISLVGYTNVGKSSLFNTLTEANVHAADQMFATLDPTFRQVILPSIGQCVLVDTVGFVRDLPHDLVKAFEGTLEETIQADIILHVVDAADPLRHERTEQVNTVLDSLEVNRQNVLEVYNKIDLLEQGSPNIEYDEQSQPKRVWLSAQENQGMNFLKEALVDRLQPKQVRGIITLDAHAGKLRNQLYEIKCVDDETTTDSGQLVLTIHLNALRLEQLCRENHLVLEQVFVPAT